MTFTYPSLLSFHSSGPDSLLDFHPRKTSFASLNTCSFPSWPNRDCLYSTVASKPTSYISDEDLFAPIEKQLHLRPTTSELSTEEQIAMMQRIAEEQHVQFIYNSQGKESREKRRLGAKKRRSLAKQMTSPTARRDGIDRPMTPGM
jgi:hypothetical protein